MPNKSDASDEAPFLSSLLTDQSLSEKYGELLTKINLPGIRKPGFTLADFTGALFGRIGRERLKAKNIQEIASAIENCLNAIKRLSDAPGTIIIERHAAGRFEGILIVMEDAPFIVNTIAECLGDAKAVVEMFSHPMLIVDQKLVALSYIEIRKLDGVTIETIIGRIRTALTHLLAVIGDLPKMAELLKAPEPDGDSNLIRSSFGTCEVEEFDSFAEWLKDGSFFFLGSCIWKEDNTLGDSFGAIKINDPWARAVLAESSQDIMAMKQEGLTLSVQKLRPRSTVHRRSSILHIALRDSQGIYKSCVGFFTSKAAAHEAEDLPILRRKLAEVLSKHGVVPNTHDFKYIVDIVDNMPIEEALIAKTDRLTEIVNLAMSVFDRSSLRVLAYLDTPGRRAVSVIIVPTELYNSDVRNELREIIEQTCEAEPGSADIVVDSTKRRQQRVYISVPLPEESKTPPQLDELQHKLNLVTQTWDDRLQDLLRNSNIPEADSVNFVEAFPHDYQARYPIEWAKQDVVSMLSLGSESSLAVDFTPRLGSTESVISIFSRGAPLTISHVVPVLENIALETISAHSYIATPDASEPIYLLKLDVLSRDGNGLKADIFRRIVGPGIIAVLTGKTDNDRLNSLLHSVALEIRSISLLRTYCNLLWQVQKVATRATIKESLACNPRCALLLWQIFDVRFNPKLGLARQAREETSKEIETAFTQELRAVSDITHDRALRAIFSLLTNSVRTNFYTGSETIVVKLLSEAIDVMPLPRPKYELFINSPRIEATHLRSASVARGGIRWSERPEDFRAEVLGLMKTQRVKNVIIVPSGAKGGFVVRHLPKESDKIPAAVETAYKEFIRGCLSVADNRIGDQVVHPEGLVVYDQPDPYFVVAADKGTATFSDIANSIAINEFKFWLGDAFASGGSHGYDHKKYGITAKGGWECVRRHFHDLQIPFEGEPFTAVGIGDMSGDVFGNAMLLSKSMKLIAAFNHKHIFIDPDPDPTLSFNERERLFKVPRSQWSDYNRDLISAGGGIFGRYDKEIIVTPQIRAALQLDELVPGTIDGERLINYILKAPVDLLWNGGIGTYVKSSLESNSDVNDGTNDAVRINADELRAKVVGEGGNLGFTQKARCEYSSRGGRINTDAIDNSGGVDLSDHEVNLKLLTAGLIQSGKLDFEKRNQLLSSIAPDVTSAVLEHNRGQALMLSLAEERSARSLDQFHSLVRDMHRLGLLHRTLDGLPDDEEFNERQAHRKGLYRPELAICSAATKMWLKEQLRESKLLDDKLLDRRLLAYFPETVNERFHDDVLAHPLRRDLIAAEIVNEMLAAVGISFVHNTCSVLNMPASLVVEAFLAADTIIGTNELRRQLQRFDTHLNSGTYLQLLQQASRAVGEATHWLLIGHGSSASMTELIETYSDSFHLLVDHCDEIFSGREAVRHNQRFNQYLATGLTEEEARFFSVYRRMYAILEVLWTSRKFSSNARVTASVYSHVLEELGVNSVLKYESSIESANKWEQELVSSSYHEIRRSISRISGDLIVKGNTDPEQLHKTLEKNPSYEAVKSTTAEIEERSRQKKPFLIAALPVIARQLRLYEIE